MPKAFYREIIIPDSRERVGYIESDTGEPGTWSGFLDFWDKDSPVLVIAKVNESWAMFEVLRKFSIDCISGSSGEMRSLYDLDKVTRMTYERYSHLVRAVTPLMRKALDRHMESNGRK